jgi:protein gp37
MDLAWVRGLRDKCRAAGVPFYFKQANGLYPGRNGVLDGRRYEEMPPLRTFPLPLFSRSE